MKLGTLLAAGKSMMKGQLNVSYRPSRQVYLPKFGSDKNPFKPEAPATAAEMDKPAPVAPPIPPRPTRIAPETSNGAATSQFSSPAQTPPAHSTITGKKKAHWAGLLNPARIFHGSTDAGAQKTLERTAKTQKSAGTQTELSLDTVKVVHNDLSDVDVEIVPMKSRPAVADEPAPKKSWEFLSERLLHTEAS